MLNDYNRVQFEPLLNGPGTVLTGDAIAAPALFQYKLQYSRLEAARMLDIGVRTLDRLIEGKQLPVRRIGRRVLITRDALEKFIKKDHETVIH
jgi:excisionase family DNA binding protein